MAVDKLVDSTQLDACCTAEANAIRAKTGSSAQIAYDWANSKGFADAIAAISGGGGGNFTLIGTKVFSNVAEYTSASAWEYMDTEINIKNTDYAFGYIVVTCDSEILTSTEWGMTVSLWGRQSTGNVMSTTDCQQKGSATLSKAAMTTGSMCTGSYGVALTNNKSTIQIGRKCNASACPKIRAGNYTVKVYGMTAM